MRRDEVHIIRNSYSQRRLNEAIEVVVRRSGLEAMHLFIKGRCMSISFPSTSSTHSFLSKLHVCPYPPYCIPVLKLSYSAHQCPSRRKVKRTYYSQGTPIHSPSIPIPPKLLSSSAPMLHPYFPPYQRRAPTTLPLPSFFGLCNLLFGSLLLEYRTK